MPGREYPQPNLNKLSPTERAAELGRRRALVVAANNTSEDEGLGAPINAGSEHFGGRPRIALAFFEMATRSRIVEDTGLAPC